MKGDVGKNHDGRRVFMQECGVFSNRVVHAEFLCRIEALLMASTNCDREFVTNKIFWLFFPGVSFLLVKLPLRF